MRIARSTSPRRRYRFPSARCVSTVSLSTSMSLMKTSIALSGCSVEEIVDALEVIGSEAAGLAFARGLARGAACRQPAGAGRHRQQQPQSLESEQRIRTSRDAACFARHRRMRGDHRSVRRRPEPRPDEVYPCPNAETGAATDGPGESAEAGARMRPRLERQAHFQIHALAKPLARLEVGNVFRRKRYRRAPSWGCGRRARDGSGGRSCRSPGSRYVHRLRDTPPCVRGSPSPPARRPGGRAGTASAQSVR